MAEAKLKHNAITKALFDQITAGLKEIAEANEILLAEESGSGVREIDKAVKDLYSKAKWDDKGNLANKDALDKETLNVVSAWAKAEEARKAYKSLVEAARNSYRTDVLKEEAKETPETEVDKDKVKEQRGIVMKSLDLLKDYATTNNHTDIVAWCDSVEIPRVGSHGTSVVGKKKPRARVKVGDQVYDTFGEAAKQVSTVLSKNGDKVTYSSGDLSAAWEEQGSKDSFDFHGLSLTVIPKETKK